MTGFRPISQPVGDSVRPSCGDIPLNKKASPHFTERGCLSQNGFLPQSARSGVEPVRVSGAEAYIANWTAQKAA